MGEILIMLVNQFVVSTEMAVLNVVEIILCGKPTAATVITLILQPAIAFTILVDFPQLDSTLSQVMSPSITVKLITSAT